jgi:hypothetical protein
MSICKNIIIRILGNDISTIHSNTQTYSNLSFTIINEHNFENTDKLYLLNRIIDVHTRDTIIELLNKHSISYIEIPFDYNEFKLIPKLDNSVKNICEDILISSKNINPDTYDNLSRGLCKHRLYIMNINAARNYCIDFGKTHGYIWTFVLDSNNFFTYEHYNNIIKNINPDTEYISIPQIRLSDKQYTNDIILSSPELLDEFGVYEHQLAFKNTSMLKFNEQLPYGSANKAEFLNALGVPGQWSRWGLDLRRLDIEQRNFDSTCYQTLSKIIRLSPGTSNNNINTNWINRMLGTYLIIKQLNP